MFLAGNFDILATPFIADNDRKEVLESIVSSMDENKDLSPYIPRATEIYETFVKHYDVPLFQTSRGFSGHLWNNPFGGPSTQVEYQKMLAEGKELAKKQQQSEQDISIQFTEEDKQRLALIESLTTTKFVSYLTYAKLIYWTLHKDAAMKAQIYYDTTFFSLTDPKQLWLGRLLHLEPTKSVDKQPQLYLIADTLKKMICGILNVQKSPVEADLFQKQVNLSRFQQV